VRCSRCGNENPDGNRFCGMCGAALLSAPPVAASPLQRPASSVPNIPTSPVPQPSRPQTAEAPRSAPAPQPSISGPSFLGLNDRSPHRRTRASLSIDPHSSSNVDYLLDDEDEPRHGGAGKVLLILIALALAVGFGYLRWKNQGLSWLNLGSHKPAAAVQNSESNDGNAPASSGSAPDSQPSPAAPSIAPASGTTQPSSGAQPSGGAQPPGATAPNGNPPAAATPTTPAAAPAATGPATTAPANNTPPTGDAANANPAANSAAKPADDGSSAASAQPSAPTTPTRDDNPPAAPTPKPAAKPRAARPPAPTVDPVAEAQQYLYGRGAAQDCDRGLRILKPAANAGNAKAMIEMGALYSAGLCTPHDLPTAYRWFALALRKDPSNDQVQTDLQKLWSEMTQPERQLAIKLSQ
jgi:cytoskeletal protein RodZ